MELRNRENPHCYGSSAKLSSCMESLSFCIHLVSSIDRRDKCSKSPSLGTLLEYCSLSLAGCSDLSHLRLFGPCFTHRAFGGGRRIAETNIPSTHKSEHGHPRLLHHYPATCVNVMFIQSVVEYFRSEVPRFRR
jgi:hypothetical protein